MNPKVFKTPVEVIRQFKQVLVFRALFKETGAAMGLQQRVKGNHEIDVSEAVQLADGMERIGKQLIEAAALTVKIAKQVGDRVLHNGATNGNGKAKTKKKAAKKSAKKTAKPAAKKSSAKPAAKPHTNGKAEPVVVSESAA